MEREIDKICQYLGAALIARKGRVATVESCTGGGIAHCITAQAGSSDWFDRGFVTYSNAAKCEMVGVAEDLLDEYGAVSVEVAEAMALGGIDFSAADFSISVTGVAGPGGGSESKPVGTVCFGFAKRDIDGSSTLLKVERVWFDGDRAAVRDQSVMHGMQRLLSFVAA